MNECFCGLVEQRAQTKVRSILAVLRKRWERVLNATARSMGGERMGSGEVKGVIHRLQEPRWTGWSKEKGGEVVFRTIREGGKGKGNGAHAQIEHV